MPTERIAMRRVREMLRLRLDAELSVQEVAQRTGVARSTLLKCHHATLYRALNLPQSEPAG